MTFEQALALAFQTGQTGFSAAWADVSGQQVLSVTMPDPRFASTFLVTLLAMRFNSAAASGFTLSPAVPPDNQVNTRYFSAPGGSESIAFNLTGPYVTLLFGSGNSAEVCYIDYPFAGCTFQVSGGFVRVQVPSTRESISVPPPNVGGFISYSPGGRASLAQPTLTSGIKLASNQPAGAVLFPVPPRAVGYRLWTDQRLVFNQAFAAFVQQLAYPTALTNEQGLSVQASAQATVFTAQGGVPLVLANAQGTDYARLDTRTTVLQITVDGFEEEEDLDVGVIWQLDLG